MQHRDIPARAAREAILLSWGGRWRTTGALDVALLARLTAGFTAEELNRLCCAAEQRAARDGRAAPGMSDFEEALDEVVLAGALPVLLDADERRAAAYHAAGHAVVAWLTPGQRSPAWVTILGPDPCPDVAPAVAEGRPDALLSELDVLLGGPAAEELMALEETSTNTERDRAEALRLAWLVAALQRTGEAQALIDARMRAVRALLEAARPQLDRCAGLLIVDETLPADAVEQLLRGSPRNGRQELVG